MSKIIEIDCQTGESIERDMNAQEIAEAEARAAEFELAETERLAAAEAAAAKKATVLAAIAEATGLTAEDISEALA
jgi:hypothetical protein